MSEEKKVAELQKDLDECEKQFREFCRYRRCQDCEYYYARMDCKNQILAEKLTAKGYCRASDLAAKIFAEIEGLMLDGAIGGKYPAKVINPEKYAELKKKYTEARNEQKAD